MVTDSTIKIYIAQRIQDCTEELERFQRKFIEWPVGTLESSWSTFRAAALKHVLSVVAKQLDDHPIALARKYAQEQVNIRAKRGSPSTQETVNLMRDEMMSAWAEAVDILGSEV